MITVRRSSERGLTDLKWLKSYHSFSFGGYYDPHFMGYESLRVFNEDFVNPGGGFPEHQHANMEIFSYVVSGALEHKDNLGQPTVIEENYFQRMSSGTGIMHSEYNANSDRPVHFLQFWITPRTLNAKPSYDQKFFNPKLRRGRFQLISCESETEDLLFVNQSINIYLGCFDGQESAKHPISDQRRSWLYVVRGSIYLNGFMLEKGDSVGIDKEQMIILNQGRDSEVILFDFLHPALK